MAKQPFNTSWSASRYEDWAKCPHFYALKHRDKLSDDPWDEARGESPLDRGSRIHKLAELVIKGRLDPDALPKELVAHQEKFKELLTHGASGEAEWAFDKDYNETEWFAKDAWLRVKMDAHYIIPDARMCKVIDWKTGKIKDYGQDKQMELYAMAAFKRYPGVFDTVEVELVFLDHKPSMIPPNPSKNKYALWQVDSIQKSWARRTTPMFADVSFTPTPGHACRFCPYTAEKTAARAAKGDARPGCKF